MDFKKKIIQYYDECEIHYRIHWDLDKNLTFNYGYWDENTLALDEALRNLNRILTAKARIKSTDRVLDAGCGVGGPAIFLTKNFGCDIVGVNICANQIKSAQMHVQKNKLNEKIKFELKDYSNTGYPHESFDVVWAIESMCHSNKKEDFLFEAYRLLKKNGRLILADFFVENKPINKIDHFILRRMAEGWVVPAFAQQDVFVNQMKNIGFVNIEVVDITDNIMPSAQKIYQSFFRGFLVTKVGHVLGKVSDIVMKNVWTAYYQYLAFKRKTCRYKVVLGEKK